MNRIRHSGFMVDPATVRKTVAEPRAVSFPDDPARPQPQQEPRVVVSGGYERPTGEQSLGTSHVDVPGRIDGGDGIRVELENRGYVVSMDIAELTIAEGGDPSQMWLPAWSDGAPAAEVRRVAVNAVPADAPADNNLYGRRNHGWENIATLNVPWDNVTGKPDVFPPEDHTHPIEEVEELPQTLFDINSTLQTLYEIKIEDAPLDGEQYVRQSGNWAPVDIPPPFDGYTKTQSDARYVDVTGDSMTGALQVPLGSLTSASLHFGNTQTGLYGSGTQVNVTVSGATRLAIASTAIIPGVPLRGQAGTAAAPAYSFNTMTGAGVYAVSAAEIGLATSGARRLKIADAALTADVPIILPADPTTALQAATKQYVDLREIKTDKGAVNGYAPLDGSAKVPAINLPAYVDDVLEYTNVAAFPATGTVGVIYIALDTNKVYRWGGSSYTEISPSPGSTDAVPEGATNKYYTDERVDDRAAALIKNGTGITWTYDDVNGTLTPTVSVGNSAIQGDAVSNSQLANMPAKTIKGNDTATLGDAKDLTAAETIALLGLDATYINAGGDAMTGRLGIADGTEAAPAIYFTGEPTVGICRPQIGAIGFTANGAKRFSVSGSGAFSEVPLWLPADPVNGLQAATKQYVDSKVVAPVDAYTKTESDTNYVNVSGDTMTGILGLTAGSAIAPSLHFGTANTGLFGTPTQLAWTVGGLLRATMTSGVMTFMMQIRQIDGAQSSPGYAFTSKTDMGMYRTVDTLGLAVGGTGRFLISATGNTSTVPVVLPADPVNLMEAATKQYVDSKGGGGSAISVSDTAPGSPSANSLWWESDTGGLFLYYNDGNTSQYVQVNGSQDAYNPIRLNPNVISQNVTIPTGYNGMTAGPITIASGVTVDIASGSVWTVV